MGIKQMILESSDEQNVLDFLKNIITGTEWENIVFLCYLTTCHCEERSDAAIP